MRPVCRALQVAGAGTTLLILLLVAVMTITQHPSIIICRQPNALEVNTLLTIKLLSNSYIARPSQTLHLHKNMLMPH